MKEETLEEFIQREGYPEGHTQDIWETGVRDGIAWQQERMYSEEDVREAFRQGQDNMDYSNMYGWDTKLTEQEWFEQYKKK